MILFIAQLATLQDIIESSIILFEVIVQVTKWELTTCHDHISLPNTDKLEKSLATSFLSAIAQGVIFSAQDKLTSQFTQLKITFCVDSTSQSDVKNKDWINHVLLSIFNSLSNAFQTDITTKKRNENIIHKCNHLLNSNIKSFILIIITNKFYSQYFQFTVYHILSDQCHHHSLTLI